MEPKHLVTWWAVVSSGLSPVLLVAAWVYAGTRQPAAYSPLRQTVSVMAGYAGTDRWIMTAALLVIGGCHLVTAAGFPGVGTPARLVLVVAGIASIGVALAPEPVDGSTSQHLAWTALGAAAITVWPAFAMRRHTPATRLIGVRASVVVAAVFLCLLGWMIVETQGGWQLGLAERLTSSVDVLWPFVVALVLKRSEVRTPQTPAVRLPPAAMTVAEVAGRSADPPVFCEAWRRSR